MIIRKSPAEIERIARAGALVAETISHVGERLEPGITTLELDQIAERFIRAAGGIPTSMGYKQYPRAICISTNDVVVHGIPDGTVVEEGDLVTIDVGVTLGGAIADSAYTFGVGSIDPESQRLLDVARTRSPPASRRRGSATGSGTSRTRCRPSSRARASRSSRASSATASGATTTRTPTCRTSASRAAARASRRG